MLCAGSASVFLSLIDILYNLENGMYRPAPGHSGAGIIEMIINLLTISLGAAVILWAWRRSREILPWA